MRILPDILVDILLTLGTRESVEILDYLVASDHASIGELSAVLGIDVECVKQRVGELVAAGPVNPVIGYEDIEYVPTEMARRLVYNLLKVFN